MARLLGAIGLLLFGVAVAVSALAVRENQPRTSTSDDAAGAGAASAAPRIANMARLRFGLEYAARSSRMSADGKLATAMTNDWSAEGLFTLSDDASSGFVAAREIARFAPGAGQVWLAGPTAVLVAVSQPTKRSLLKVIGGDGKSVELGDAEFTGPIAASPDGRWIAVAEGLSQTSQIRIFDRTGSVAPRVIAQGMRSIVGGIQWDANARVLYPNARMVVAVDLSGRDTSYSMSADASAFGVVGMSPDRSVAVIDVNVSNGESVRLLEGGSTRALPSGIVQPIVWVGPHEMVGRSDDGQLFAADAHGKERVLGVVMKSSDVRVLAYSAPYLLWIDNPLARVHLSDLAASKDVTVGANPLPSAAQPHGDGRFLITRNDVNFGADVLSGPSWVARLPPAPKPGATPAGAAAGYRRIASDEGGWSMEIPEKWVAETGNLRGAEIASFDMQSTDFSGNAPAPDQFRIRVTVMPEYDHLSLEELGAKGGLSMPGPVVEQVATTLASQPAVRTLMPYSSPKPFDSDHVYWHVRSPFFVDRVLIVDAWPADGALRAAADHAIATFELFAPKPPSTAAISRAQAIESVRNILERAGRVDRIAAKLVTNHELEQGSAFGHNYTVDPDDLLWVVAATGDFASMGFGGPMPLPDASPDSPPRDRLIVNILHASTGDAFGFMSSGDGVWPAWVEALKDPAP